MDSRIKLSLLCSLPFLLNACASNQYPQKNEELVWKERIEQRLDSISAAAPVADNNEELTKLQARIFLLEVENRRELLYVQNQLIAASTQMAICNQELKTVHSSLSKLKDKAGKEPQPVVQMDNQRQNKRIKRVYYDAYLTLKNGDYFKASLAFRNFLQDFPEAKLVDEEKYWYGESLLAQGETVEALEVFQDIIKEKSTTPRHAAAILKAGLIYDEQQKKNEATFLYNLLIRQHPASSEAETAHARLELKERQG